jgi:hypothetical protein
MTHYCGACVVNWWPYMTNKGACPECGGGTVRKPSEPASDDAKERYAAVKARRAREELYRDFETYYAERELERGPDAWKDAA